MARTEVATPRRVGRKLEYPEKREAAFAEGVIDRIKAVLHDDETFASFVRDAAMAELARREIKT